MSAVQLGWLANHFEQGKITQEEFTSLYARINNSEKEAVTRQRQVVKSSRVVSKVARLHPETRRTLARVRTFKKLVSVVNYTMVLALISVIYLAAEHYQVTGSLPSANIAGLEKLLTQTPRKPLPMDIRQAAEVLSQHSSWDESHIQQFKERWDNTLLSERQRYSKEHWFQSLRLVLSLHIIEQRSLAKSGNRKAMQHTILLTQLEKFLEKDTA